MKIVALTRYDQTGASSRVRFYQFVRFLESRGLEVELFPLLDSEYVRRLLAGQGRSATNLLRRYTQRVRCLLRGTRADVLWIEKEVFPWAPAWVDRVGLGSVPYVVDYDDAIFHNYDENPNALLRSLFRGKIPAFVRRAAAVTAGNAYLADFAARSGAKRVETIPSVVDGTIFKPRLESRSEVFTVGWIGSPATQHLLEPVLPVLSSILTPGKDRFVTVGGRYDRPIFPGHKSLDWSLETEADLVAGFDVGIMPLRDAPFERGKCGFKLVQYMACGVPLIASPVGVNASMVVPGVNGFLASTPEDWERTLKSLKASAAMRSAMGSNARQEFETRYSFAVHAPRVAEILLDVGNRGG